jgi:hypothetical protein
MRIFVWVVNPTEKAKPHRKTRLTEKPSVVHSATYNAFSHSKNDLDFFSITQEPQR